MSGPERRAARGLIVRQDPQGRRHVLVDGARFLVFQIHYDERSRRRTGRWWTPYLNTRVSPFLESAAIADLLDAAHHRTADYFGVFSWKFAAKIPLGPAEMFRRIRRDGCQADVYTFFGRLGRQRVWALAERKHRGIVAAAATLLKRLDIETDVEHLEAPVVYQNHFLCRSPLYERFGRELLAPALAVMADTTDRELQARLQRDAGYRSPRVPVPLLTALFGRPYFCLQPFVAERLFSTWLALNPDVRVCHIWRGRFVEATNVRFEPEMRPPATRGPS